MIRCIFTRIRYNCYGFTNNENTLVQVRLSQISHPVLDTGSRM